MTDNSQKEYRKHLEEHWALLVRQLYDDAISFDKLVTTLASGALGLSITFYRELFPTPNKIGLTALVISWVCFAISLFAILLSYLSAIDARKKVISQIDDYLGGNEDIKWHTSVLTRRSNFASVASLILGVLLFLLFIILNLE